MVVVVPPAASAVVALGTVGLVPHIDEVGVTGFHSAPDEVLAVGQGDIDGSQQFLATVLVQTVSVGYEPQPRWPISRSPPEPDLVEVVLYRDAKAGQLSQIEDRASRSSELEVEQGNSDAVTKDNVLQTHVVVAYHCSARWVGQTVVPSEALRVKALGGVVKAAKQFDHGYQCAIRLAPLRIWRYRNLAFDKHKSLTPIIINADRLRNSIKSSTSHCPKKSVNRTRVRIRRAKNMRTDPDYLPSIRDPPTKGLLNHTSQRAIEEQLAR